MTIQASLPSLKIETKEGHFKSGLVGRHQVPVPSLVAAFALQQGLTPSASTSRELRRQSHTNIACRTCCENVRVIDDTYNGNLEGIRAGTELLSQLSAKKNLCHARIGRSGHEAQRVHQEIGQLITKASPDIVVLMRNSTTAAIQKGLELGGYRGNIRIEDNPLVLSESGPICCPGRPCSDAERLDRQLRLIY